jgi:DNA-binding GntR family transcriptional regulator
MAFKPLPASNKRDRISDLIRRAILRGELRPGERIVESRIARELGVSQAPVREALALLRREGLVMQIEHRGAFVASLNDEEFAEVLTLRAVLEGYCARLVAPRLYPPDRDALEEILGEMRRAAADNDLARVTDADLRFHQTLYRHSGHQLLADVLLSLRQRMQLALVVADASYSPELSDVAESHMPLLGALLNGDPDAADDAARDHVLAGFRSWAVEEPATSAKLAALGVDSIPESSAASGR